MEKILIIKRSIYALLLIALTNGCGSSNHLVFVQEASFGLNISAGTEGTQKLSLGYDRDVYAIVPKKNNDDEAMSLFSVNRAEIISLDDMDISEFVAVGAPAKMIAKDPAIIKALRTKIYGE